MQFNKDNLLHALESVEPGLASKQGVVEQSNCYVFQNGEVASFNDEIACRCPLDLGGLTGAVPADKLLELLRKLPEDELGIENGEGELRLNGKRREVGIRIEKDVALPISTVEKPGKWRELADDFCEAVALVGECASSDASRFELTCIHVHPEWVEACDQFQLCRWTLDTGMSKPTLVRQQTLRHVGALGMTEVSETDGWLHFRNKKGVVMSCRRYLEDFHDFTQFLEVKGETVVLPKGLADAADRASVFSSEDKDNDRVTVDLKGGKLTISGQGMSGWIKERKKVKWTGKPLKFLISPKLLIGIVKRTNECVIAEERLKIANGPWTYVACLVKPESKEPKEEGTEGGE